MSFIIAILMCLGIIGGPGDYVSGMQESYQSEINAALNDPEFTDCVNGHLSDSEGILIDDVEL